MLGWLADQSPPVRVLRTRPGAKGYGDDHWQTVVARYRQALKDYPTAPTKALIEQYPNWSPATIRCWLTVVRKRGLLQTTDRNAGSAWPTR